MAIKIISATHKGIDGVLINVEVDITRGIPSFNIIVYISRIILSLAMTQLYKGKSSLLRQVMPKHLKNDMLHEADAESSWGYI